MLHGLRTLDAQDVLRVQRALRQLLAGVNVVAVLRPQAVGRWDRVLPLLAFLEDDRQLALLDGHLPGGTCDQIRRDLDRLDFCALLRLRLLGPREQRTRLDLLAVLHEDLGLLRQLVLVAVLLDVDDAHSTLVAVADDLDDAVDLGDDRRALRHARLEQLLDTRETRCDVQPGHTTGVERAHRQLRARLADRLRGDDADGLAVRDEPAPRARSRP